MRNTLSMLVMIALVACGGEDDAADGGSGGARDAGAGIVDGGGRADGGRADGGPPVGFAKDFREEVGRIACDMDASALEASGAARVSLGGATVYAGYQQSSGVNQDPVVARVDGDTVTWCVRYEDDGPDGRAQAVTWDGADRLYVVFTIVGGGSDLDAIARGGWQPSYGMGGGPKVSVIGRLDPATGAAVAGTYVISKLMSGRTNTHGPRDAVDLLDGDRIAFYGASAFQPLNPDRAIMSCTDYPFDYRAILSGDLRTMECASSTNCTASTDCP